MNRLEETTRRYPMIPPYYLGRPLRVYLERYQRERKRKRSQDSR